MSPDDFERLFKKPAEELQRWRTRADLARLRMLEYDSLGDAEVAKFWKRRYWLAEAKYWELFNRIYKIGE